MKLRALALGLALVAGLAAHTASAATAPVFAGKAKADLAQILNASGTNPVTLVTAGTLGSRRSSLTCTNTDTNPYSLQVSRVRSGVSYLLATVTIPASAGNVAGTFRTAVLSAANFPGIPVEENNNPYVLLESGDTLTIALTATITSGKIVSCEATGVDF